MNKTELNHKIICFVCYLSRDQRISLFVSLHLIDWAMCPELRSIIISIINFDSRKLEYYRWFMQCRAILIWFFFIASIHALIMGMGEGKKSKKKKKLFHASRSLNLICSEWRMLVSDKQQQQQQKLRSTL